MEELPHLRQTHYLKLPSLVVAVEEDIQPQVLSEELVEVHFMVEVAEVVVEVLQQVTYPQREPQVVNQVLIWLVVEVRVERQVQPHQVLVPQELQEHLLRQVLVEVAVVEHQPQVHQEVLVE